MIDIWLPSNRAVEGLGDDPPAHAGEPPAVELDLAQRYRFWRLTCVVRRLLAGAYRSAGRIDEARGAAEEALSLSEELRHPWRSRSPAGSLAGSTSSPASSRAPNAT